MTEEKYYCLDLKGKPCLGPTGNKVILTGDKNKIESCLKKGYILKEI